MESRIILNAFKSEGITGPYDLLRVPENKPIGGNFW